MRDALRFAETPNKLRIDVRAGSGPVAIVTGRSYTKQPDLMVRVEGEDAEITSRAFGEACRIAFAHVPAVPLLARTATPSRGGAPPPPTEATASTDGHAGVVGWIERHPVLVGAFFSALSLAALIIIAIATH
jgi:hypothetical protein